MGLSVENCLPTPWYMAVYDPVPLCLDGLDGLDAETTCWYNLMAGDTSE